MSVYNNYDKASVLRLLKKDEDELLKRFRQVHDNRRWRPRHQVSKVSDLHWASLIRFVLYFSDGRENFLQGHYDSKCTDLDNANLCSAFLGITGSKPFGSFDVQKMRNALSMSKVFNTVNVRGLKIWTLTIEMMKFVPFGTMQPVVGCFKLYF